MNETRTETRSGGRKRNKQIIKKQTAGDKQNVSESSFHTHLNLLRALRTWINLMFIC